MDKLGLADAPQKLTKERVCKLGLAEAPQRKVQRIEITAATLNDVKETFIREIGNPSKIDLDKNPPSGRHKEKIKNSGEVKTKVPLSENITEKTFIREIGNSSKIDLYAERCWQKKRAERRSESRKADPRERTVPCEAEMRCCPRSDHDHSNGNHNQCKSIGKERYKTQQYTKNKTIATRRTTGGAGGGAGEGKIKVNIKDFCGKNNRHTRPGNIKMKALDLEVGGGSTRRDGPGANCEEQEVAREGKKVIEGKSGDGATLEEVRPEEKPCRRNQVRPETMTKTEAGSYLALSYIVLSFLVLPVLVWSYIVLYFLVWSSLVLYCVLPCLVFSFQVWSYLALSCVLPCIVLSFLVWSYIVLSCVLPCLVLSSLVWYYTAFSCRVFSCLVLSCLVLRLALSCLLFSCLVLSCLVLCLALSLLVFSCVCFVDVSSNWCFHRGCWDVPHCLPLPLLMCMPPLPLDSGFASDLTM